MASMNHSTQTNFMLKWFFDVGVSSVDIHLRFPTVTGAEYQSNDWIWLTKHESLSLENAQKIIKWCRFKNYHGSDIFIRPHRYDRQPVVFLDDLSVSKAMTVANKYRAQVIETSPDNTQVWIALSKKLSEGERKTLQQYISKMDFTDKGSISGEHLGRLCAFRSQKRNHWVHHIHCSSAEKYTPPSLVASHFPQGGACANRELGVKSQSEKDFSWVLSRLRKGLSPDQVLRILCDSARLRGKMAPQKYAERTVQRAMKIIE
jgi:hypothetical protein